jgi:hypothetical protein
MTCCGLPLCLQLLVYDALGFTPPVFGHMSLILAPDKSKLSKRHGATSVGDFKAQVRLAVQYLSLDATAVAGLDQLTRGGATSVKDFKAQVLQTFCVVTHCMVMSYTPMSMAWHIELCGVLWWCTAAELLWLSMCNVLNLPSCGTTFRPCSLLVQQPGIHLTL